MPAMTNNDPRSLLATSPMSSLQILVCTVTVFLNALDGFDLLAISFATSGIMSEFHIPPAAGLGLVLSMDLVGMAIGSFCSAELPTTSATARNSRVPVVMATGMYLCSHANSEATLPCTDSSPAGHRRHAGSHQCHRCRVLQRQTAQVLGRAHDHRLSTGQHPRGARPFASAEDPHLARGVRTGAVATAVMIPVVWICVPESISWLCASNRQMRSPG
jgi:hypothetical protein